MEIIQALDLASEIRHVCVSVHVFVCMCVYIRVFSYSILLFSTYLVPYYAFCYQSEDIFAGLGYYLLE